MDKCLFLHELVSENDIIIDSNNVFAYDDHIKLAKKIIDFYNPKTKNFIIQLKKPKNIKLPFLDFIFLSEKEKENYFGLEHIAYFSNNKNSQNNINLNQLMKKIISKKIIIILRLTLILFFLITIMLIRIILWIN